MSSARSGLLPLLVIAGVVAVGAGIFAARRAPETAGLRLGSPAPDFRLETLGSTPPASLAELRGKVVFVNFWATWCPPCREEAPSLERLYQKLGRQGFEIVAISNDAPADLAKVEAFRDELGLSFPILLDPEREAYDAYGVYGLPETFLVDRDGRVAERFIGPRNWDEPRFERAVRRLLEAPNNASLSDRGTRDG